MERTTLQKSQNGAFNGFLSNFIQLFCRRPIAQGSESFVSTWIFKMSRKIPNLSGVRSRFLRCRALFRAQTPDSFTFSRDIPHFHFLHKHVLMWNPKFGHGLELFKKLGGKPTHEMACNEKKFSTNKVWSVDRIPLCSAQFMLTKVKNI